MVGYTLALLGVLGLFIVCAVTLPKIIEAEKIEDEAREANYYKCDNHVAILDTTSETGVSCAACDIELNPDTGEEWK